MYNQEKEHIGMLQIPETTLLGLLDLEGGRIRHVGMDRYGIVDIIIQHPDFPEVQIGDKIAPVPLAYCQEVDDKGHLVKCERIKPEKSNVDFSSCCKFPI